MTEEEKKNNPDFYVRKGYLKTFSWNEVWANFWKETDEENRQKFLNLPNFSWDVFTKITGIKSDNKKSELLSKADELIKKAEELKEEAEKL